MKKGINFSGDSSSLRSMAVRHKKDGSFRYPERFRKEILERIDAGYSSASLAREAGISPNIVYRWKQARRKDRNLKQTKDLPKPRVIKVESSKEVKSCDLSLRFEVGGFSVVISRS